MLILIAQLSRLLKLTGRYRCPWFNPFTKVKKSDSPGKRW